MWSHACNTVANFQAAMTRDYSVYYLPLHYFSKSSVKVDFNEIEDKDVWLSHYFVF